MKNLSFQVLRKRDFRNLLLTRLFSTFAMQAQAVIVGWQIYSLTKSPFLLGMVGLTEAVPALIGSLFAGHVVDVSCPQRVRMLCTGAMLMTMLFLLVTAGGFVSVPDNELLYMIFAAVFVSGITRSFTMPAVFALMPHLVTEKELSSATAWNNSAFQIAGICGPAVAGIIYGGYGAKGAWLVPTLLLAASFVLTINMSKKTDFRSKEKKEPTLKSIHMAWAFLFKHPVLLSVMALDMFAVLFGGATAMLPAYADQVLHVGSQGLGALRAAPALGAVVTALFLAVRPLKTLSMKRLLWAVAGFGVCMIGFGFSTSFYLSMALLVASGILDTINVLIRATVTQLLTPQYMRGRIAAIRSMFIISSNEIGSFESGVAARFMGLVPSVVFGGCATLAVVAFFAVSSKKFRNTVVSAEPAH